MMDKFGFIAHTFEIDNLKEYTPSLANKSPSQCKRALENLPAKDVSTIRIISTDSRKCVEGVLATTWLLPEQYLRLPKNKVLKKILDATRILQREGATIVGLGGYNSIVPPGAGRIVARNSRVGVTNGNTLTIMSAVDATLKAIDMLDRRMERMTACIVGATGSIGSVITEIICRHPFEKFLICGRSRLRLEAKAEKMRAQTGAEIDWSENAPECVKRSDVVITATSTPERILNPGDFKSGAIVCDVAYPHDVSEEVAAARPDVFCFEGGLVRVPRLKASPDYSKAFKLPRDTVFACFAETALLSLEGIERDFSLDGIQVEQVDYMSELAMKHGFGTAPFKNSRGYLDIDAFRQAALEDALV